MGFTLEELHSRAMEILLPIDISPDNVKIGNTYNWGFDVHTLGYKFNFTYDDREIMLRQLWFQAIRNLSLLPPSLLKHLFKIYNNGIYDRFENRLLATMRLGIATKRHFELMPTNLQANISDPDPITKFAECGIIGSSYQWDESVYIASHNLQHIKKDEDTIEFHMIRKELRLEKLSAMVRIKGFSISMTNLKNPSWMDIFDTPLDIYDNNKYNISPPNMFRRKLELPLYSGFNIFVEWTGSIWVKVGKAWKLSDMSECYSTEITDEIQMFRNTYSAGN